MFGTMGSPYADLRLEHSSTVDRTVEEIRRALFAGELSPGTPLREVGLAEALGVSRSTVREALTVLVGDGVVVRTPNRGVAVKALSATDVTDVIRARTGLETAGVRQWAAAGEADRQEVRDALARYQNLASAPSAPVDPRLWTEAHLALHRALVGLTRSQRLLATADAVSGEIRLGLAHLDRTRGNLAEQVADHRRLVVLLESGDLAGAATELERHLAAAQRSLMEATGNRV